MKKFMTIGAVCACAALMLSCANDNEQDVKGPDRNEGLVAVKFVAKTPAAYATGTRAMGQVSQDGFRILAYRLDETSGDYLYFSDIDTSDFTPITTSNDYHIEGTAYLDYGDYKFVPTYNMNGGNLSWETFTKGSNLLSNDRMITMGTGATALPELFLDVRSGAEANPVEAATSASIRLDGTNPTQVDDPVVLTLGRAVGRVDVYFVKAEYDENDNIVEVAMAPGENVFGGYTNENMTLKFTNLNGVANYFGVPSTVAPTMSSNYIIPTFTEGQTVIAGQQVTLENNTSLVGGTQFANYDNIQPENVAQGGYYFVGPYFFGQQGTDATARLTVEIENTESASSLRNIPIATNIPVERNKVTIVKIYVMAPHVYSTNANFEVVVDTVWADSETVTEILD